MVALDLNLPFKQARLVPVRLGKLINKTQTTHNVKSQLILQQGASNITGPINFLLTFRKYPGPFWTFLMILKIN